MAAMNPLLVLAEHAAGWRHRTPDAALEHHARRALVDWFGCLLAGAVRPPARLLAAALGEETGPATCHVTGRSVPLRRAALLNATASHTVEFDDIHRDSVHHPGCATIAAALAAAEAEGRDMAALLAAVIAGYEVGCRIGLAVQPAHYAHWHTTGTVGTIGAAAAVAVILGLDAGRTAHALALAATFAAGLQQTLRGGGMGKPLHAGHAAEAGALAALAAARGVTGALEALDGPAGFAAATSGDRGRWETALAGLGQSFAITAITVKNHGCCGHIFAALDAVAALRDRYGFTPETVAAIEVGGYAATKELCDRPEAATEQDCRFSVQYAVAALLRFGAVRLAAFTPDRIADPAVRALMRRISVHLDPACAAAFPARRSATVTVRLTDGRCLVHHQPTRKGDPEAPLDDAELDAKFRELAAEALVPSAAEALLEALRRGSTLPRLEPAAWRGGRPEPSDEGPSTRAGGGAAVAADQPMSPPLPPAC